MFRPWKQADRVRRQAERLGQLEGELANLRDQLKERDARIAKLEKLLEEARRAGKRQAGPFSKGDPKPDPKRAGRKPGKRYGRRGQRPIPRKVDERIEVPCPAVCDRKGCSGAVRPVDQAKQYQTDLPPVVAHTTEFVVGYGFCLECGKTVQGRHPRQTSDAVRVGNVQIGPRAIAFAGYLKVVGGISYGKVALVMQQVLGLEVARSTLCRAMKRLADKAEPTYDGLVEKIRGSPVVYPDETGWKVGGWRAWLWAFTNKKETVYLIEKGRGYPEAAKVLGSDYSGVIGADGWAPYRRFRQAQMQTCLAHLLRRSGEILETATRGAVKFPRAVKAILQSALTVRDRRDAGQISVHGAAVARGRLKARMGRLRSGRITNPQNRRFAAHLRRYEDALFRFLERDDVEATNWPAEQAIRPAVVNRKTCAGNRTDTGAKAQAILMSVLRTCHQKSLRSLDVLAQILRQRTPRPHRHVLADSETR